MAGKKQVKTVEQEVAPVVIKKQYKVKRTFSGFVIDQTIFGTVGEILELEPRHAKELPTHVEEI